LKKPGATDLGPFPNQCPDSLSALMKFNTLLAFGHGFSRVRLNPWHPAIIEHGINLKLSLT
jgi:hypothetical protein